MNRRHVAGIVLLIVANVILQGVVGIDSELIIGVQLLYAGLRLLDDWLLDE